MFLFQLLFAVAVVNPEALADQLRRQGASDIGIQRVQLDGDSPLEAVVRYELPGSGVHAVVLDLSGSEWRSAGRFNSWWEYTKADGERFLEFRETVVAGVFDLLVRIRSGGTEDSRTTLEIWRMRAGALEEVLSLVEREAAMVHPSGDVVVSEARLTFSPGRIIARTIRNGGAPGTCQQFQWDSVSFRFTGAPCA